MDRDIIIFRTENYVNWNERLKLLHKVLETKKEEKKLSAETYRVRPDIWFNRIEKDIIVVNHEIFSFLK
jgi:hypothetical protein